MKNIKIIFFIFVSLMSLMINNLPLSFAENSSDSMETGMTVDFKNVQVGTLPDDWYSDFTGQGIMPIWKVVNDNGKNVVAQLSSDQPENHFNLLVWNKKEYQDVSLEVKLKAVKGSEDRGGGLVWRYIDINNYYIARVNPLENNFTVYKVVNGSRRTLASANIEMQSDVWMIISITMMGNRIECYYNGKKYLEATDGTFTKPGKIGLWTKADAVTYFDNLTIK